MYEDIFVRIAADRMRRNPADRADDAGFYLELLEPYRDNLCASQFRIGKALSAKRIRQNVCRGRQKYAKLIGRKVVATGTVGK